MIEVKFMLPSCPETIDEIDKLLTKLSTAWAESESRPKLDKKNSEYWDQLISDWINEKELPLYIRKFNETESRGKLLIHHTGRQVIPTDNSPAHWSYVMAYSGINPSIREMYKFIENDEIPIALALKKAEKEKAHYKGLRNTIANPNKLGWKVCHKEPIGLRLKGSITKMPINILKDHFRLFLSPSNMFLVPKILSGIGEIYQMTMTMKNKL